MTSRSGFSSSAAIAVQIRVRVKIRVRVNICVGRLLLELGQRPRAVSPRVPSATRLVLLGRSSLAAVTGVAARLSRPDPRLPARDCPAAPADRERARAGSPAADASSSHQATTAPPISPAMSQPSPTSAPSRPLRPRPSSPGHQEARSSNPVAGGSSALPPYPSVITRVTVPLGAA